jgi:DNA-3-methyladenine glycosylase
MKENTVDKAEIWLENDYQVAELFSFSRRLLGCKLNSMVEGKLTSGIIVETEAYNGVHDAACHAHLGRHTKRTEVMYDLGGRAYVYPCYGIHALFNIVLGPVGQADVILIRALEPMDGIDVMTERRGKEIQKGRLCKGPGALTKALGIKTSHNKISVNSNLLWIEKGTTVEPSQILIGPRIGIGVGKDEMLPYRYWVKDSKYVSAGRKGELFSDI